MGVVIVGAGHAAGQVVSSLRRLGWEGDITLIGEEAYLPYQRPFLSKQLLAGTIDEARVFLNEGAPFYAHARVEVLLGTPVLSIDRATRTVQVPEDRWVEYEHLVLATGARVRRLALPGSDLGRIHYLRDLDDARQIRRRLRPGARLVVVGGGYIGLEVAAVAADAGLRVTVIEAADRVMNRVVGPEVSRFYEALHRRHEVDIRTATAVTGFDGDGMVRSVLTDAGAVPCDLVVVGVGVVAETALAEAAGLAVDDGIVVDVYARTTDPDIFAVGDCTNHPCGPYAGRRVRLECVQNAVDQAAAAARSICGTPLPHDAVPWFWSDQYDVRLQISGLSQGHDETVLRGDPATGEFSVLYLRDDVVVAVDAVNCPHDYMLGKRLIAARSPSAQVRIADCGVRSASQAAESPAERMARSMEPEYAGMPISESAATATTACAGGIHTGIDRSAEPTVTYRQPDGSEVTVAARVGQSVKDVAVSHLVPGILAECGGVCACATCHVYVDDAWRSVVGGPDEIEAEMLAFTASEARGNSRLACQIKIRESLDGLIVQVPEQQ